MKTKIFFLAVLFSCTACLSSYGQNVLKVFNNTSMKTYVSLQYYSNGVFKTVKSNGQIAPGDGDKITLEANPKSIKVKAYYDKSGKMTVFYDDYVQDGTVSISFSGNPPSLKARLAKPTVSSGYQSLPLKPTTSKEKPAVSKNIHVSVNNRSDWDVQFRYVYSLNGKTTYSSWNFIKGKAGSLKHADGSGTGLSGIQFQWLDGLKWKSLGNATYKKTDGSTNWSFLVTGQVFPPKPIKLSF